MKRHEWSPMRAWNDETVCRYCTFPEDHSIHKIIVTKTKGQRLRRGD